MRATFIYLIAEAQPEPCAGLVKIGIASDIARRLASLQTGNGRPLSCIGVVGAYESRTDALAAEAELHARFAALRCSGEWFRAAPEVLDMAARAYRTPEDALAQIVREVKPWHGRRAGGRLVCLRCSDVPVVFEGVEGAWAACFGCGAKTKLQPTPEAAVSRWNGGDVTYPAMRYRSQRPAAANLR